LTIKLTLRGIRVTIAVSLIFLVGYVLRDFFLVPLSLLGFAFIIYEHWDLSESLKQMEQIELNPDSFSLTAIAGQTVSEIIQISTPFELELCLDLEHAKISPSLVQPGDSYIELTYSPILSGIKKGTEIPVTLFTGYRLFTSTQPLKIDLRLQTYPRVFPVAARALEALAEMGTGATGQQVTRLRGSSLEYAESRDYTPGDDLRHFDWKATAKTQRPMVKDYYVEGGGGINIVYDNFADNQVSLDELNHAFLQLVTSLTQNEENIKLHLIDKSESYTLDRFNTLLVALRIALEGQTQQFTKYYTLIEPRTSRVTFYQKLLEHNVKPLSRKIAEYAPINVIITSLVGNQKLLLENIDGFDSQDISLLIPTRPWLYQKTLQQSNNTYQTFQKNLRRVQPRGFKIFQKPEQLISD
jgi:hypothetical protein